MGRPSKLTKEIQDAICKDLRGGVPRYVAAQRSNVGMSTFKQWMRWGCTKDPNRSQYRTFRAAVKKAEAEAVNRYAQVIYKAAGKTWQAAAWWLERRHPEEWASNRSEIRQLQKQLEDLLAKVKALAPEQNPPADPTSQPGPGPAPTPDV